MRFGPPKICAPANHPHTSGNWLPPGHARATSYESLENDTVSGLYTTLPWEESDSDRDRLDNARGIRIATAWRTQESAGHAPSPEHATSMGRIGNERVIM